MLSIKSSKSKKLAVRLGIFVFGLLIAVLLSAFALGRKKQSTSSLKSNRPEIDNLIENKLAQAGYSNRFGQYWAAIAKHETGNYTSALFKNGNNLFGMGVPTRRPSIRIGEIQSNEGLKSKYSGPTQSIEDLILYLKALNYARDYPNIDSLVHEMKTHGYFTDLDYLSKVQKWL